MKKIFLWVLMLAPLSMQAQNCGNATVKKVNGFEIYIFSEPVKPYKEAFELSGFWNFGELAGKQATFDNIVETMVRNAKKKNEKAKKKGEPEATALILYSNEKGSAIYFEKEKQ